MKTTVLPKPNLTLDYHLNYPLKYRLEVYKFDPTWIKLTILFAIKGLLSYRKQIISCTTKAVMMDSRMVFVIIL